MRSNAGYRHVVLLALSCLWAACSEDEPKGTPIAAKSTTAQVSAPVPSKAPDESETARDERAAKPSLTGPELQQLLDAWLKSQNDGDFAAYQALYAPHMHGVKRVGEREYRMDHAKWMKDRERMFGKKMEVAAHTVTFRSLMVTAVIEFVQVFRSGKFMDSGPKRLMVRMHDGAPRIVQEEMMRSDVISLREAFLDRVYLTFPVGNATYVAIQERAEPSWGSGKFVIEGTRETIEPYAQQVDASLVPQAKHWLSTQVRVYDDAGTTCDATVTELKLILIVDEYTVHDEAEAARIAALSGDEKIDAEARHILREESALLVGKLSACTGGVLATPIDKPGPVFCAPQAPDRAITQAAIAATKALPKYRELQAEWEAMWRTMQDDGQPSEPASDWGGDGTVDLFGALPGPRFAIVRYGNSGHEAEMSDLMFVLYRVDDQGALTLVRASSQWTAPKLLVDVDVDGVPEVMSHEGVSSLFGVGSHGVYLIKLVPYIYNGCTC